MVIAGYELQHRLAERLEVVHERHVVAVLRLGQRGVVVQLEALLVVDGEVGFVAFE